MERRITNYPDRWVILKINENTYKVFASWKGLDGRWRLNSGIEKVEQDEDSYYLIGHSGSCYKCDKKEYGTASTYAFDLLNKTIAANKGKVEYIDYNMWEQIVKEKYII